MKRAGIALLILMGTATFLSSTATPAAEDQPTPDRMFAKKCANCHTVPDPGLPADRVWIDQIRETT